MHPLARPDSLFEHRTAYSSQKSPPPSGAENLPDGPTLMRETCPAAPSHALTASPRCLNMNLSEQSKAIFEFGTEDTERFNFPT